MPGEILIFRIGSLGDTLVAVPAIRAVRDAHPGRPIALLCDRQIGRDYVLASDLLRGTGLVDEFLDYPFDPRAWGRLVQPLRAAALLMRLRGRRVETVVYLAPSNRPVASVERDRRFFRMTGARRLIGFRRFPAFPAERPAAGFASVPREADLLLARLAADGIPVPEHGTADPSISLGEDDRAEVERWRASQPPDGGRAWMSVGPGCKQPVNRWPRERFESVVRALIARNDVWPVVVGGPQDAEDAHRLVAAWGRGSIAAGRLSLRGTMEAMRRSVLHVGSDTGTIHMAAAVGVRCVGVYSSRNLPGLWYPYGNGHTILRTAIECENCQLFDCVERKMECILRISEDQVIAACEGALAGTRRGSAGRGPGQPDLLG